jgi:hypothetical protein
MVEYYVLMYGNGKMRPVETVPGMGRGDKGEWWRVNSTMIIARTLVNVTM